MESIENIYRIIAGNIRIRRRLQRLSQACLAEKADLSVDTVKKAESGTSSMRLDTYLRLVDALGMTPMEFLEAESQGAYAELLIFMIEGCSEK